MVNNLVVIVGKEYVDTYKDTLRKNLDACNLLGTVFDKDNVEIGKNYIEYKHKNESLWCTFDFYMKNISKAMPEARFELERLDFERGLMCFVYKNGELIDVMGAELSWFTIDDWEDVVAKSPDYMWR